MHCGLPPLLGLLPACRPWQLGTLMWSLGMLNIDPGPAWLDAFCAASIRCMQRAARNALGSTAASGNFSGGWGSSGNDILGGNAGRYTFIDGERVFLWSSGFRDKDECSVKALVGVIECLCGSSILRGAQRFCSAVCSWPQRASFCLACAAHLLCRVNASCAGNNLMSHMACWLQVNMAWGLARVKHNVPTAWFEAFCAQVTPLSIP
jgi:hypothetical protein